MSKINIEERFIIPTNHMKEFAPLLYRYAAYFGESDRSFRFYPITFSSSFSSLPVLP